MHEELIKNLRRCGAGDCDKCELRTPFLDCQDDLLKQAADAIEEMNKCLDGVSADNDELCKTIEELSKPRWIPVTERLPEEHVFVLIRQDEDRMMVAERVDGDWWYRYFAYDVDRWDENEQGTITHWLPLLQPPKEE